jgi:predicted transcriptional regulator
MSTTKEEAMTLISRLPDEVTWEDIMYRLYVKTKIEEGIKAEKEGRTLSHEEVKGLFARE